MIELMGFKFFFSFQFCDNKKKLVIFFPQKLAKLVKFTVGKKSPIIFLRKKKNHLIE
jgi:hypothetical protein